jgi:hypothetical protein
MGSSSNSSFEAQIADEVVAYWSRRKGARVNRCTAHTGWHWAHAVVQRTPDGKAHGFAFTSESQRLQVSDSGASSSSVHQPALASNEGTQWGFATAFKFLSPCVCSTHQKPPA